MAYKIEKIINAPLKKVWDAWTSEQETQQWLAPKSKVDFEEGGAYEFFWNKDPNVDSTLGCKIRSIDEEKQITFDWQGKSEFLEMFKKPYGPTLIEVGFLGMAPEKTKLILEQHETRKLENWKAYDEWMQLAWIHAINSLKKYVEQ